MFDIYFDYADGRSFDVKNVKKIAFEKCGNLTELIGDSIQDAQIPLKTLFLYTDNGSFTVSGDNLMVINVVKHNS